jgi:hypothetical protein
MYSALTFDIEDSKLQNILLDVGFVIVVQKVSMVRSTGIVVIAPVCGSFSWMSRHSSGRTVLEPLGNLRSLKVKEGNMMVSRVILILMLIMARGSVFVMEQPAGSILPSHPRFEAFIKKHIIFKVLAVAHASTLDDQTWSHFAIIRYLQPPQVTFRMCWFGGDSQKPMVLFSNAPWISEIANMGNKLLTGAQRLADLSPDESGW